VTSSSLSSGRDFQRVYRTGTKARADGITVWTTRSSAEPVTRLGIAIRASVGTAVQRNRLRRRVRAIMRAYRPAPGLDVVIAADRCASSATFQELETHTRAALARAGVETST
jgi:ribonuclease P protein component